jgi:hypothetical protein
LGNTTGNPTVSIHKAAPPDSQNSEDSQDMTPAGFVHFFPKAAQPHSDPSNGDQFSDGVSRATKREIETSTVEEQFEIGKAMVVQRFVEQLKEMLAGVLRQRRVFGELQISIDSQDTVRADELAVMENDLKAQELKVDKLMQVPARLNAATSMAEMQRIMDTAFDFG